MANNQTGEKTRPQLIQEIEEARARFNNNPHNKDFRFELAERVFEGGGFWEARTLLQPLLDDQPDDRTVFRAAHLEYLLGKYESTEDLLIPLIEKQHAEPSKRVQSEVKLLFCCYHTNQFSRAHDLLKGMEGQIQLPIWEQMKSFKDEPYQVNWQGERMTEVPFILTDPLPLIALEIQGKNIYALIDTGGDNLYLDSEYAAALGIEAVATAEGTFGGGVKGEIGFAQGANLTLGEVTLNPVPITIMPTQRWSKGFADGKYPIGGVIGTGVLKQFLATLDYPAGRLVLRPRDEQDRQMFNTEAQGKATVSIPFVLEATHLMMAKGSLNGIPDLTFFVDSGLASTAAFTAPIQTLEYAGIPVPETKIHTDSIGGGGDGLWASGSFPIRELGLGPLTQKNAEGDYGSLTPETYWRHGFIQDGLISHRFLRRYRWTLDFDAMQYHFIEP